MQYDLSVSTFSPDGKVFQTDYAQKAVDNSGCASGVHMSHLPGL
jgi:20S proteasome subunit alpha 7